MIRLRKTDGNGDPCPVDSGHGRMYVLSSGSQYCPSSSHRDRAVYEADGRTVRQRQEPVK